MKEKSIVLYEDERNDHYFTLYGRAFGAVYNKSFKKRPRVAWYYPLDHAGVQYIEIRPGYEQMNAEEEAEARDMLGENAPPPGRMFDPTDEHTISAGIMVDGKVMGLGNVFTAKVDNDFSFVMAWGHPSEAVAQAAEAVASALKVAIEDPAKLAALETSNCCYCGKALADAESVSRGYGPDCAKEHHLPYTQIPSAKKPPPAPPVIVDHLGNPLRSLADAEMVPTERAYISYSGGEQHKRTVIEPRALLYKGSSISKYRRKVTIWRDGASGGIYRSETSLVSLAVEPYAQYSMALSVVGVNKKQRHRWVSTFTPEDHHLYGDQGCNPFCVIVDGWGHGHRYKRKTGETVSGFKLPTLPEQSSEEQAEYGVRPQMLRYGKAFQEAFKQYVAANNVTVLVEMYNHQGELPSDKGLADHPVKYPAGTN